MGSQRVRNNLVTKQPPPITLPWSCAGLRLSVVNAGRGPAPVVLIMTVRHPSAITIRTFWENKGLLLIEPWNYIAHLSPHRSRGETEREHTHVGLGFCFYWDQGWGCRVLEAYSIGELKTQELEFKDEGEKNWSPSDQLLKPTRPLKQRNCRRKEWLVVCLF